MEILLKNNLLKLCLKQFCQRLLEAGVNAQDDLGDEDDDVVPNSGTVAESSI